MNNGLHKYLAGALALLLVAANVHGQTTDLASAPLVTSSGTTVLPNMMFILDDSGSMDSNYVPDWAAANDPVTTVPYTSTPKIFRNNGFNGVAYDPSVTYTPPKKYNADGTFDTTTYPNMTGLTTSTGADATAKPNWKAVKNDGYGIQSGSSSNLVGNAYYYTFIPGEYCTAPNLKTCVTSATPSTTNTYPATLRWCNSAAMTNCQAVWISGSFYYPRYSSPRTATITVNAGTTSTQVSGITVGGFQIMSATSSGSATNTTVATNVANRINSCTTAISGNCTIVGYSASAVSNVITITAPGALSVSPVVTTATGNLTFTAAAFAAGAIPGDNLRTDIVSTTNSYSYPGTVTKATTRTDCAGTTCTYAEEITNYANWWAYYHTRMQMMKTAASNAFSSIGSNYRVGYFSINNNTGSDFLNLGMFDTAQKISWCAKLFAATPNNSTPLREALAKIGRLYAGKLNGTTFNGVTAVDPVQYSCQQNFTLLSTDGYWNGNAGYKVDGSTAVGNQDNVEPRPFYDGASVTYNKNTSQLQTSQTQLNETTSQLQSRTLQIQSSTSNLQSNTGTLQQRTGPLQWQTKLQRTDATLQWQTKQQQTTATLQWATKQQIQTGALRWTTKQQQVNSTLTWATKQQRTTATLQKSINSGGSYSNVGANSTCASNGTTILCRTISPTTAYVAFATPTCSVTYNGNTGTSTADASGNVVTACPVNASFSGATSLTAGQTCNGGGNVQCGTTAPVTTYVTTYPGTCAVTFNGASATSTANGSGKVVTCPINAAFNPTLTSVGAGGTCDGTLANIQCSNAGVAAYVTFAAPTCTVTFNAAGTSTANGSGNVVSCPVNAAFSATTNLTAGQTCNGGGNVQCTTTGPTTAYVATYPGTCAVSYNGTSASSTADVSGKVITTCPVNAAFSAATNVGSGGTCDGTLPNIKCLTTGPVTSYVATNPPACTVNYNSASSSTADASGKVITACPVSGSFSPATNVVGGGSCTPSANVNCAYNFSAWSNAASCTTNLSSGAGAWNITSGTDCQYNNTGFVNAGSCTTVAADPGPVYTVATARQCQYTAFTAYANAVTCTPAAQSGGSPYTVGTATQCQTTDTGFVGAGSCTAGVTGGQTVTCQTIATGPTPIASCTAQTAAAGNSWLQRNCNTVSISPATGVASCTADPPTAANAFISTNCTTVTTGPLVTASCTAAAANVSNSYTTTTCTLTSSTGGTSNTLADVAEYYYTTDLRTSTLGNCTGVVVPPAASGGNVCANNVPGSGLDGASWQHMTTFTLGLGGSGDMLYSASYLTNTSGDYFDVKNGTTANSAGGICSWQGNGTTCNWPTPASDAQTNIDDLWHAAVNGRGSYFQATDPSSLSSGLNSALASVSARLGASAAATTSNPNVTSGDNFIFSSTFTTQEWDGELVRQQLDLTTGILSTTIDWSAQAQLDANTTRTIYTFSSDTTTWPNQLKPFLWANLTSSEQANFNTAHMALSPLSQFCTSGTTCLSAASQTAAVGANLVNYLRGDRTNEGIPTDTSTYYRQRSHLLGDIVNAEAVYVKTSLFDFSDAGYSSFKTTNASRQGMVYAAANDGMLHAFNATTGAESWAYIPSMVLPDLYRLADKNYAGQHRYFVDGTPMQGEICPSAPGATCSGAQWKTILVGGLGGGGRGYYALDVTDPATPKALWEFTDTNLGYTFGNPEITKLADGTWVVLVASGYNNVSSGDGIGRLYVLNAATGALIRSISTGAGNTLTPSGLARIRAWVNNATSDNTALRVYGGDMLGNLWRFDINDTIPPSGYEAQRLITLYSDSAGTVAQPITVKPELGDVVGNAVVFVGTGRYLGTSDLIDTSQQSFYAVKDTLGTTPLLNPRASGSNFIQQIQTNTTCPVGAPTTICTTGQAVRTSTNNAVSFATNNGWYLDFLDSGERDNTDPQLALGTLVFNTNIPNVSACTAGGYSFTNFLDYRTGAPVSTSTSNVISVKLGNALATRPVLVRLPNNTIVGLTRMSDGTTLTTNVPIGNGSSTTRRVSWRELVNDQ